MYHNTGHRAMSRKGVQRTGSDNSLDWMVAARKLEDEPTTAAAGTVTGTGTSNHPQQLHSSFRRRAASRSNSGISFADSITILNADNSIDKIPFDMSGESAAHGGDENDDSYPSAQR